MARRDEGRKRVAVVSHGFYPTLGGSERYHFQTARALSDAAQVDVFTSTLNLPETSGMSAEPKEADLGPVHVHYLASRRAGAERLIVPSALWSSLRSFRPDVVWTNHPSPTADLGAIYALVARRTWVATYHADFSLEPKSHRLYLRWVSWLLRRARYVLVTSERYRSMLVARGVPAHRIVVAPAGPWIGEGVPPTTRATYSESGTPPAFLFVGGLDARRAYKRLDLLLEAIASIRETVPNVRLEVVGDGDQRATWERRAAELGIADRVEFFGRLADPELADRYARARALVLPAITPAEGFGAVAIEAIQYGCPVITSTSVAAGDVLAQDGAALLFDPTTAPRSLAVLLRRLAEDPAERARLAEGARRAAPKFAWNAVLPGLVGPIRSLLGSSPPPS